MRKTSTLLLCGILACALGSFGLCACSGQTSAPAAETTTPETPAAATTTPETPETPADPFVWDEASSTLTLTNATLTDPLIFDKDVTIVLVGSSTLSVAADSETSVYAIDSMSNVTLTGDGTLGITITNTVGKAGGIGAGMLSCDLGDGGRVSIDVESGSSSGRGVFVESGCALRSGQMTVNARSHGIEASSFAVYASTGDVTVDKGATLDCTCTSDDGYSNGIQASVGSVAIGGTLSVNATSPLDSSGARSYGDLTIGDDASIDLTLGSSTGLALGLESYVGSVSAGGTIKVDATGATSAGGVWAPLTIDVANADIDIRATSTADTTGEGAISSHDGVDETRVDTAYGLASDNGLAVRDSAVKLSVQSNAVPAHGLVCGSALTVGSSWLDIRAASSANEAYGILGDSYDISGTQSTPSVALDTVDAQVEAATAAIASKGELAARNVTVGEGGSIGNASGLNSFLSTGGALSTKVTLVANH